MPTIDKLRDSTLYTLHIRLHTTQHAMLTVMLTLVLLKESREYSYMKEKMPSTPTQG